MRALRAGLGAREDALGRFARTVNRENRELEVIWPLHSRHYSSLPLAPRGQGVLAPHGVSARMSRTSAPPRFGQCSQRSLLTAERGRRIDAQHAAAGHDGRNNPDESHKEWRDEQCDGVAWSDSVQL